MTIHLTEDQTTALESIKSFIRDDALDAFILRGSAGTGKTTLIATLVELMEQMNQSCALLAPTGRAARILGNKVNQILGRTEYEGLTIHKEIYVLDRIEVNEEAQTANDPGIRMVFPLKGEEPTVSLFIIDESSMVGDRETHGDFVQFGSGRLLKDIVTFARLRRPGREGDHLTKLLFVGDPAQLPPVGDPTSPALSESYLTSEFRLRVGAFDLTSVLRQAQGSAILDRATRLRDALMAKRFNSFSLKPFGPEIERVDTTERAVDLVVQSLQSKESSVAVAYSNATALEYNRNVRERLWGNADLPVQVRDTLLVNRNSRTHSLSNGDLVKVIQTDPEAEKVQVALAGDHIVELRFLKAEVAFRSGDGTIIHLQCMLLENLLSSPIRELSPLEQRALLVHFRNRHPKLHPKSAEFRKAILDDPYFNALQVKYGYAMTCHKAQGGEWDTVLVHFSHNRGSRNHDFFRWAYTAMTRAAKRLIVVNPPDFSPDSEMFPKPAETVTMDENDRRQELREDPDWLRLSFSAAVAPLMVIHQKLREIWLSKDINVERLQHLQHCERYTLVRNGTRATVQYYYDGRFRVRSHGALPGGAGDDQLLQDALQAFQEMKSDGGAEQPGRFIQEFLDRLDTALKGTAIKRTGLRMMPYRLRVTLADNDRKGDIDFPYDGSSSWKLAQEVGGPGASQGLYDDVQSLMTAGTN